MDYIDENKLTSQHIHMLIHNNRFNLELSSTDYNNLIIKLLSRNNIVSKLDPINIRDIIEFTTLPSEDIIKILLSNQNFIDNIHLFILEIILYHSYEPNNSINTLLSNKNFVRKLDTDFIDLILHFSTKPYKYKEIIQKLRPDLNYE